MEEKNRLQGSEVESNDDSAIDLKEYMEQRNILGGEPIKIVGKDDEAYSETETALANIWAKVLEIGEIDIYTNFSSLGGNSMRAVILIQVLDTVYPEMFEISDIYTYSTVAQMAEFLERKQSGEAQAEELSATAQQQAVASEDDIFDLLESLESGDSSIDSVLEKLLWMEGAE